MEVCMHIILKHVCLANDRCDSSYTLVVNGYGNARFEECIVYLSLFIKVGVCYLSIFHFCVSSLSGTQNVK